MIDNANNANDDIKAIIAYDFMFVLFSRILHIFTRNFALWIIFVPFKHCNTSVHAKRYLLYSLLTQNLRICFHVFHLLHLISDNLVGLQNFPIDCC